MMIGVKPGTSTINSQKLNEICLLYQQLQDRYVNDIAANTTFSRIFHNDMFNFICDYLDRHQCSGCNDKSGENTEHQNEERVEILEGQTSPDSDEIVEESSKIVAGTSGAQTISPCLSGDSCSNGDKADVIACRVIESSINVANDASVQHQLRFRLVQECRVVLLMM
ncbi:unnamed protein product [Orchesella dallaii]|uniref:Uncharacterized protein n=1 Tax=Orchesella dallaii TaxID=48710 RepID=A0ABP1PTT5_9HEXA